MKRLNKIIVIVLGILFLIAVFVVSVFFNPEKPEAETSLKRYDLFYELYKRLGYKIVPHYSVTLPGKDNIVIIFDYKSADIQDFGKVLEWTKGGGTLFLAGISEANDPVFSNPVDSTRHSGKILGEHAYAKDLKGSEIETRKCFKPAGSKTFPVVGTQDCSILIGGKYNDGYVYLLADSSLLIYKNMRKPAVAVFFNEFLKPFYNKKIYIYKNRYKLANDIPVLGVLFMGKLKYITIQLLIVWLFFLASKGIRFGKPLKYQKYIQRSLKTHLIAVGQFYKKASVTRLVDNISRSFSLFKLRQILKFGDSAKKRDEDFIEQLSKKAGAPRHEIEYLFISDQRTDSIARIFALEKLRARFIKRLS